MDCTILSRHLRFLVKNRLIEERRLDKKRGYAITERGKMVLKTLNYSKYLEKSHAKLPVIDEAREILRELKKSKLKEEH
jgi:DNA-binding PadR family transcriptional regulator